MTLPPPALESLATLVGWLLTYLVHSTLLLGGAWLVTRPLAGAPQVRETIWRVALLGALVTTTAQAMVVRAPLAGEWRWNAPTKVEVRSEVERVASVATAHDAPRNVPRVRVTRTFTEYRRFLAKGRVVP